MYRLLKIEFYKSWPSRYFRTMGIIWLVAFLSLPIGFKLFLMYLEYQGISLEAIPGLQPTDLPLFDFVDLWQNLTYAYKCTTIFLAILVIINITNELDYKTFRQNVIDGMSKTQFLISKLLLIISIATITTVLIFIAGLIIGFISSPVTSWSYIIEHINFLLAYWLHVMLFLSFAMLISLLLKRAGIVIAILLFWMFIAEPIGATVLTYGLRVPVLAECLPMEGIWNLLPRPIEKYFLSESRYWISTRSVSIALVQLSFYLSMIYLLLTKRDLK